MPVIPQKQSNTQPRVAPQTPKGATKTEAPDNDGWGRESYVKMLVYGESGSGKTTFASTFPAPILWLLCSGGDNPGELKSIDTPENRKRITPVVLRASTELRAQTGRDVAGYRTVVLDHASGLADLVLKELLGLDELPAQKSWGMASQQTYGQMTLQCKEYFRALLGLPCNVVLIAQQRTFGSDEATTADSVKPTVGAALTPGLTGWLNPACDYVVQAHKRPKTQEKRIKIGDKEVVTTERLTGVEYCLRTGPHEVYQTKFRIPKGRPLPEFVADPNYAKILSVIDGD